MKSGLRRVRCLLLVVKLLMLIYRLRGELHTQLAEYLNIYVGQHDGGVDLAVFQLWKLLQGDLSIFIGSGTHGKCNQNLVGVQPRIFASEIINLQLLDWFDSGGRYQMRAVGDIA